MKFQATMKPRTVVILIVLGLWTTVLLVWLLT